MATPDYTPQHFFPANQKAPTTGGKAILWAVALIFFFTVSVWYLARDSKITVDVNNPNESLQAFEGIVLENISAGTPLAGKSYAKVITGTDRVVLVDYTAGWEGCMNPDVSSALRAAARGTRIEVRGTEIGKDLFDVCSSENHQARLKGETSVTEGWKKYEDGEIGLTFMHPESWTTRVQTSAEGGGKMIRVMRPGSPKEALRVTTFEVPNVSADDWLKKYAVPDGSNRRDVILGDWEGVEVKTAVEGERKILIAVSSGARVFQAEFDELSSGSNEGFQTILGILLGTFSFTASSADQALPSGIEGIVYIGPTCPVVREGEECADLPFEADLRAVRSDGFVRKFSSDESGIFRVPLPPGMYTIESYGNRPLPTFSPVTVTVPQGKFVKRTLTFDSGIR